MTHPRGEQYLQWRWAGGRIEQLFKEERNNKQDKELRSTTMKRCKPATDSDWGI